MNSENTSLVDRFFSFWQTQPLPYKLLAGGTLFIWIIFIFGVSYLDTLPAQSMDTQIQEEQAFLPAVSESDSNTAESADENQVFIPAVSDDSEGDSEEVEEEAGTKADAGANNEEAEEIENAENDAEADMAMGGTVYIIDSDRSVATYSAVEEFLGDSGLVVGRNTNQGLNTAVGETRGISGQFTLDTEKGSPKLIGGEFSADLLQLTSVQPHRDQTLKRYWLESIKYPEATFTITQLPTLPPAYEEGSRAVFPLTGVLTVREIEKEVTFDVVARLEADTLEAIATADFLFEDFGIAPPNMAGVLRVEDSFRLIISITAVAEAE